MQAPEDVEEDDFRMLFEQMERLEPQSLRIHRITVSSGLMALTKEVAWQEVILPWSPRTGITSLVFRCFPIYPICNSYQPNLIPDYALFQSASKCFKTHQNPSTPAPSTLQPLEKYTTKRKALQHGRSAW